MISTPQAHRMDGVSHSSTIFKTESVTQTPIEAAFFCFLLLEEAGTEGRQPYAPPSLPSHAHLSLRSVPTPQAHRIAPTFSFIVFENGNVTQAHEKLLISLFSSLGGGGHQRTAPMCSAQPPKPRPPIP